MLLNMKLNKSITIIDILCERKVTVNVAKCLQLVNLGEGFMGVHCFLLATFVRA